MLNNAIEHSKGENVYATAHPQVVLIPINRMPTVERMIRHVGRGNLPDNVQLP